MLLLLAFSGIGPHPADTFHSNITTGADQIRADVRSDWDKVKSEFDKLDAELRSAS